jgi:phosphoenolpyruvate---glycerone phosphotransferase subunit DhaL
VSRTCDLAAAIATDLAQAKDQLNELDGYAGDGDLGLTVAAGCAAVLDLLPDLRSAPASELFRGIGLQLSRRVPSTSGTLVSFGLIAVGRECAAAEPGYDTGSLARILRVITRTIATRGKSTVGDKTMIDALEPAADAAREAAEQGAPLPDAVQAVARAAAAGAAATAAMSPRHGRASWLPERSAGHEDAGARAAAFALAALALTVREKEGPADQRDPASGLTTKEVE